MWLHRDWRVEDAHALSRQVRGELRTGGPALPPPWRLFSCCTMRSCHSLLLLLLIAPPLQADRQRGHLLADRRRGHIFVMNTDLRFLACDAWLCPVSESMELSPRWQRSIRECEQPERPRGWGSSIRAVRCLPRTAAALRRRREERYKQYEHPRPYLTLVMGEPLPASLLSLNQFLDQVVADLRGRSRFGRALPLVAVPIFGAGVAAAELLQFGSPSLPSDSSCRRGAGGGGRASRRRAERRDHRGDAARAARLCEPPRVRRRPLHRRLVRLWRRAAGAACSCSSPAPEHSLWP